MAKKSSQNILVGSILLIVLIFIVVLFIKPQQEQLTEEHLETFKEDEYGEEYFDFINDNMVTGGPPKDGIPSIDTPQYISVQEADIVLKDDEKIFGFDYNGVAKAFPRSILYWHEIVNEEVKGEQVSVTYCPLTESVIGFKGKNLGVSGSLYNSNLVIYDRETDSEIPQILQKAVNGPLKGQQLDTFYIYTTTWEQWKKQFPDSLILSTNTGFNRDYTRSPYPGYDSLLQVWFPVAAKSDAFHSKKIIHGVVHNNEALAIPKGESRKYLPPTYELGGETISLEYNDDLDVIKVFDSQGNQINSFDSYWFAWYAYRPETKILS
jgi:hypothetical protein